MTKWLAPSEERLFLASKKQFLVRKSSWKKRKAFEHSEAQLSPN